MEKKKPSTCCLIIEVVWSNLVMGELGPERSPPTLSNQISLIYSGKGRVKFAFASCLESEGTHSSSHSGLTLLNFNKWKRDNQVQKKRKKRKKRKCRCNGYSQSSCNSRQCAQNHKPRALEWSKATAYHGHTCVWRVDCPPWMRVHSGPTAASSSSHVKLSNTL